MASEESTNKLIKIVSSLFVVIIAPIIVGIGVNYSQKALDKVVPIEEKKEDVAKSADAAKAAGGKGLLADASSVQPAKAPLKVSPAAKGSIAKATSATLRSLRAGRLIPFFNGRNLKGFTRYLGSPKEGTPPLGKDDDPDHVFIARDGELHVSGKVFGGLISLGSYENYKLRLDYRWGPRTWAPRHNMPKFSGVVVHGFGKEGALRNALIQGYRCHFGSRGGTGDIHIAELLKTNTLSLTVEAEEWASGQGDHTMLHYTYTPGAIVTKLTRGVVNHLDGPRIDPATKKVTPTKNFEKPVDDWNTVEIYCVRDRMEVVLNGTTVNALSKLSLTKGRVQFISEGAEIFFSNIKMWALEPEG